MNTRTINKGFRRKHAENVQLELLDHVIPPTRRPQYYALHFHETENTFQIEQVGRKDDWALKIDFKVKGSVSITIRGSLSLISKRGKVIDVTGNLILKQSSPQDHLSIYSHGCGIRVCGSLISKVGCMSIHCSHGPAILAGGSIFAENISSLRIIGSESMVSIQDVFLSAPPNVNAEISIQGGLRTGGNVKVINASVNMIPSEQPSSLLT